MSVINTRATQQAAAWVALALSGLSTTEARQAVQPGSSKITETVSSPTLNGAIESVGSYIVELGFPTAAVRPYSKEMAPNVQAIYDRWRAYSDAVGTANKDGAPPNALTEAQRSFVTWVKDQLKEAEIELPNVPAKGFEKYPGLAEDALVLSAGFESLLLHHGVIFLSNRQQVIQDRAHPEQFVFVMHPADRLYAVTDLNPKLWTNMFPGLVKDGIPLAQTQLLAGTPYRRDAAGNFTDAGSFEKRGIAFIDLTAVAVMTESLKMAKEPTIRHFIPLTDKSVTEVLGMLASGALPPEITGELVKRMKEGGFALDCLVALAGTDRHTVPFSWEAVTGHRVLELIAHEGEHGRDGLSKNPREQMIGRIRLRGVLCTNDQRVEAEALAEMGVRVESMRHSLVYPMQLMGERRAGFSSFGKEYTGFGARQAQQEISDAIIAEIKSSPKRWGVTLVEPELKLGSTTFTVDEQVMAQFHRPFATKELATAMADAVETRLKLDERKEALAAKFGYRKTAE